VIMSATLEAASFSQYFGYGACHSSGKIERLIELVRWLVVPRCCTLKADSIQSTCFMLLNRKQTTLMQRWYRGTCAAQGAMGETVPLSHQASVGARQITVIQIHLLSEPGDILVFMTGQEEIEALESLLKQRAEMLEQHIESKLLVCPLYAALPYHQQMQVFDPAPENTRKVILATNIAETSITINGIRYERVWESDANE